MRGQDKTQQEKDNDHNENVQKFDRGSYESCLLKRAKLELNRVVRCEGREVINDVPSQISQGRPHQADRPMIDEARADEWMWAKEGSDNGGRWECETYRLTVGMALLSTRTQGGLRSGSTERSGDPCSTARCIWGVISWRDPL